ncbi:MAG: hypothetical protein C0407_03525 [Desulfobacca sp.]|nr:hypothetical protein [Desulfobacca sp.]
MAIRNLFKKLFLILLIILVGSFSFAEDKKALSPGSAVQQQQNCDKDNKKTSSLNTSNPFPRSALEKMGTNPESLTPPSFMEESLDGES